MHSTFSPDDRKIILLFLHQDMVLKGGGGGEEWWGLHFTSPAAVTKEIPAAKGHLRGQPGCAAFQSERHEGKTRGKFAEAPSWKRDSEFIPSRGGREPSDHIHQHSHRGS